MNNIDGNVPGNPIIIQMSSVDKFVFTELARKKIDINVPVKNLVLMV